MLDADQAAAVALGDALQAVGYASDATHNVQEGVALLHQASYAVALVSAALPGGLEPALALLRAHQANLPMLVCLSRGSAGRLAAERRAQSAPVLQPPISWALAEQVAEQIRLGQSGQAGARWSLRVGPLTLDFRGVEVQVRGQPAGLAPQEFCLLRVLCDRLGQVVSRRALAALVWSGTLGPEHPSLTVHMSRLRGKLDRVGGLGDYLVTKRGRGYLLSPEIRKVA